MSKVNFEKIGTFLVEKINQITRSRCLLEGKKTLKVQRIWSKCPLLLLRYCLEKEDADDYVLCDVIGQTGTDNQWRRECFRVVGDHERPLMLQSLWKPKEGFSRRFEIQRRASVEEQSIQDRDTITAGNQSLWVRVRTLIAA